MDAVVLVCLILTTLLPGIVTLCTSAVTTYSGMIAARFFLGLAEAGFYPGVIMYLCFCKFGHFARMT